MTGGDGKGELQKECFYFGSYCVWLKYFYGGKYEPDYKNYGACRAWKRRY